MEHDTPSQSESTAEVGMREAYRLVVDQVEQLEKARQIIDAKLARALEAKESLRQFLFDEDLQPQAKRVLQAQEFIEKKQKRFRKGSRTAEVIARSKTILRAAGRPMDRGELLEQIIASGFKITTNDPSRFIGRTLWESDDFVHVPKRGYWLAGETF